MIVLGLADTIMVGKYGSKELAAASFVNAIFALVVIFAIGFSYGMTPLVGARYGAKDKEGVGRIIVAGWGSSTTVALGVSVVLTAFYFCLPYLGQPVVLLPEIQTYYLIQLFSVPFILWFSMLKQFSDGVGDTRMPMWVMIFGDVLNIFGNWLLIFGVWGCPRMGLAGAGWATFASRALSFALLGYIFYFTHHYSPYREVVHGMRILRSDYRLLLRTGLPIALQMGMEASSFSVVTIFLGWLGASALAAHQIMNSVGSICFMIYYGIGAAVAVRVSHFNGQGAFMEIRRTASTGAIMILASGIVMSAMVFIVRNHLCGWFTKDVAVEETLLSLILPFLLYQIGDAMQTNYANALRGMQDVKPLIRYAFIAYIVVSIPASFVFGILLHGGARGIWFGFPIGLTTAAVLFARRFYGHFGFWKR